MTDTSLVALDEYHKFSRTGFWPALTASNPIMYLTTPIFSPVNPMAKSLTLSDFAKALIEPKPNNSLVVIGYTNLAINRSILLR